MSAAGIITTVAGNGVSGFSGDGGPATAASLRGPHNVVSLPDGGFLIADTTNERVRHVDADGIISTVMGDGVRGDSGDGGPAASARVSAPKAISLTERGDLLIADEQNNRIRFVGTVVIPTNLSPPAISGDAPGGGQLLASSGVWHGTGPQLSYQWQRCRTVCENIPGAMDKRYTPGAADAGAALRVAVTASNPAGDRTVASARTSTVREPSGSRLPPETGPSTPPGKAGPGVAPPRPTNWLVRASMTFQRAQEYTVRTRNRRLSDAITAYGRPSCRVVTAKHVVATWVERGIRIDSLSNRALPSGKTGCSSPSLIYVSEIRLTDRRWVTSLGLRVGDTIARLRRLYPRSPYVRSQRNEYYLVWRHARCTRSCTPQTRRHGVNFPRLSAQVANGRVVALWLPVLGQRR